MHGQGELVPQIPAEDDQAPGESEPPEEVMERLAHLEQLVVQLKGLILDKDTQLTQKDTELANKDAQFKAGGRAQLRLARDDCAGLALIVVAVCLQSEKEELDARFTKLKLQAKAKMASLNKQISELKGQGGATVSPSAARSAGVSESVGRDLTPVWSAAESRELLHGGRRRGDAGTEEQAERGGGQQPTAAGATAPHRAAARGEGGRPRRAGDWDLCQFSPISPEGKPLNPVCLFAPQLLKLQAVVCEKDVRFQEQVQKHEEELLSVTAQSRDDAELQRVQEASSNPDPALGQ